MYGSNLRYTAKAVTPHEDKDLAEPTQDPNTNARAFLQTSTANDDDEHARYIVSSYESDFSLSMGSFVPSNTAILAAGGLGILLILVTVISLTSKLGGSEVIIDDDESIDSSSLRFTLKRDGYEPLTYFTSRTTWYSDDSNTPSPTANLSPTQQPQKHHIRTLDEKRRLDHMTTPSPTPYPTPSVLTPLADFMTYSVLASHVAVIEPYADMYLSLFSFDYSDRYDYKYTICPMQSNNPKDCALGWIFQGEYDAPVNIECSPYDIYSISVTEYNADGRYPRNQFSGTAICLYVRREIRSLTESDLNATMDAMFTMWDISEHEGSKKYGSNFHAASYFVEAHEFNSAQQDSDHMHEGIGFLPQHIKLTNIFDLSLRSINPAVTVPYWDYTIDRYSSSNIAESFVFQPETFGTLTQPASQFWGWTWRNDSIESGKIPDGRWKDIKVDKNTKYKDLKNSFGTVRGTWSTNPSEYVSRFASKSPVLPSCSTYYSWVQKNDIGSFFYTANNDPHASTHGAIGGSFGCDAFDDMRKGGYLKNPSSQVSLCSQWGFYMKDLYRNNYISIKDEGCSFDSYEKEDIDCGFQCNEDTYDDMSSFIKSIFNSEWTPPTMTDAGWDAWRDFICEGDAHLIFFGDHLDPSVSPSDPSFWPIHPSQERLLHAKYATGGFDDDVWPSDPIGDYVCSLASCYEADYDKTDYFDECCYGHYEYDQLLDFVNGDKDSGYGPTNHDILVGTKVTDADSYNMDYIYDSLAWDHCDEDFDTLFTSLWSASSIRRRRRLNGD